MKISGIIFFCLLGFSVFYPVNVLSDGNNNIPKSLFENKCSKCHGLERITQTVKTPVQWSATVHRMKEKDIHWISDKEVQAIATYLATQFAVKESNQNNHSGQWNIPPGIPELFGIITFCLLLITVLIGFVMTHGRRRLFKIHRTIAYVTLASGVIHGTLIFISY